MKRKTGWNLEAIMESILYSEFEKIRVRLSELRICELALTSGVGNIRGKVRKEESERDKEMVKGKGKEKDNGFTYVTYK